MHQKLLFVLLVLFGGTTLLQAQLTVSGVVTDASGSESLPGVTILEVGTTNGAVTDIDGRYEMVVEGPESVLRFSYVGYDAQEVTVGDRTSIDLELGVASELLDEVVVTAFGMERQKKALGYAVTEVEGEELQIAKEVSVAANLAGRVAGLNVTRPTTGAAGSTNIVVRGVGSLTGDNRALIVVDGVPINNTNLNSAGMWGGIDTGDGLTSINPDDIETVNVLKGAAAGALYGERGANGVILITTKKGQRNRSIGLEYNSNFTLDEAAIFPDFYQREYGPGANGQRPMSQLEAQENWQSWGARLDGQPTVGFDGVERPYSPVAADDVLNFYRTGYTWVNTVAMSGGNERASARLSLGNLTNEGIVPNSGYDRYTVNLTSSLNLGDRLTFEMKANYVQEEARNRINLSDNPSNPGKAFSRLPATISVDQLRNSLRNENGQAVPFSRTDPFTINPFWGPLEHRQMDEKRRFIGYVLGRYRFTDWLSVQARQAIDYTNFDYFYSEAPGTEHNVQGAIQQTNYELNDNTRDFIVMLTPQVSENLSLDVNLGGVQNPRSRFDYQIGGSGFIVPGLFNINNLANRNPGGYQISEVQTNALYATALLDYRGYAFLDLSVRNDWYSTLTNPDDPEGSDNSAVYGGASGSLVFSEAFGLDNDRFSFGKVRMSYGVAGNGAPDPYLLLLTYGIESLPYNGNPLGRVATNTFPGTGLRPTITRTFEAGFDLRFLRNRVGVDLTYYNQNTVDQLFQASLPRPTSYERFFVNAGDVRNRGVEVATYVTPVRTSDLEWTLSFNFAANRNTVVNLTEGIDNLSGESARFSANLISEVGGQVNSIFGTVFERDEQGRIVHNESGLPVVAADREVLGNYQPDWYGGLNSQLTYKNLSFGLLFDTKQGGEIYSITNLIALANGRHPRTLVGRDNPDFEIVGEGVTETGTPNVTPAPLDQYYSTVATVAEENIFDASYIKLRQATLSYRFDDRFVERTPLNGLSVALTGRNLFFLQNGLSELGLDPEAVYNIGGSGFEYSTIPSQRSFGVSLNARF